MPRRDAGRRGRVVSFAVPCITCALLGVVLGDTGCAGVEPGDTEFGSGDTATLPDTAENLPQDEISDANAPSDAFPAAPDETDSSTPGGSDDTELPDSEPIEDWDDTDNEPSRPTQNDGDEPVVDAGAVAEAVDFVAQQFCAAAAVFSTYAELGDPRLDLSPNQTVEWGMCPEVRIASSEEISLISFHFTGCAAPSVARREVSGDSGHIVWHPPWDATVHVTDDFTIAGRKIVPLYDHPLVEAEPVVMDATMFVGGTGVTLDGPCDFETKGIGRATGYLSLDVEPDYTLTFIEAELLFAAAAHEQSTSLAGMRVRPAAYSNFVPDSGTAMFDVEAEGLHTVVVTFLGTSPQNGMVTVSIDGGAATPHELPGELW